MSHSYTRRGVLNQAAANGRRLNDAEAATLPPIVRDYLKHLAAIRPEVSTETRRRHAKRAGACLSVMNSAALDRAASAATEYGLNANADYLFGGPIPPARTEAA